MTNDGFLRSALEERSVGNHARVLSLLAALWLALGTIVTPASATPMQRDPAAAKINGIGSATRLRTFPYRARLGATVHPSPCADDPAFYCGSVTVPLDRAHPQGKKLHIAFEILPHSDSSSTAKDAIFASNGGPGFSTTANRSFFAQYLLGSLSDERDIVLIDPRGTGGSGAIDCPALQAGRYGAAQHRADVAACGRQLGSSADRYGSGDIAMDAEAIRKALAIPQIDYWAQSYGTVFQQAYAVRYPDHLRAIVADSGFTVTDPGHRYGWGLGFPAKLRQAVTLACRRAPTCAATIADPGGEFAWLAHRLGRHPIVGTGLDSEGHPHHVVVDQYGLISIAYSSFDTVPAGQLPAAAVALRRGDPVPLLRLAANAGIDVRAANQGDVHDYSAGANAATTCNDVNMPFSRSAPERVRQHQYDRALAALSSGAFAPMTKSIWTAWNWTDQCMGWPRPKRFVPPIPSYATFPGVPALVLAGDLDPIATTATRGLMDEYPNAKFVVLAGALHPSSAWSQCGRDIVARFIRTRRAGDTSCASVPGTVGPAVSDFPVWGAGEAPAHPIAGAGDRSNRKDRLAAAAAVHAITDAVIQVYEQPCCPSTDTGPGLRGGEFDADYTNWPHVKLVLRGVRFVRDVAEWGHIALNNMSGRLVADVKIRGAGTAAGHLHIVGYFGSSFATFTVHGRIGGRWVVVTVPAN